MARLLFILFSLLPFFSFGQETITIKEKNKQAHYKEIYDVLKNDQNVKQGPYKRISFSGAMLIEGQYINGKKNGMWKEYYSFGENELSSVGQYKDGEKIGIWEYYLPTRELEDRYDFTNNTLLYSKPGTVSKLLKIIVDKDTVEAIPNETPFYIEGNDMMNRYIAHTVRYPSEAVENSIEGRVLIQFTISKDSIASDFRVKEGISKECDQEALRVISSLPGKWAPGIYKGKPRDMVYVLPFTFKLM